MSDTAPKKHLGSCAKYNTAIAMKTKFLLYRVTVRLNWEPMKVNVGSNANGVARRPYVKM